MVQPDRIETKSGHPVSELLRPLLRKILRTGAEIGPIETNRLIGSIPERQLPIADHHRTVFPGRRIEAAGEIQRGPWQHILAVPDRLPVPSRNNVHRRTREARNPLISDRGSDDAPDGTAGRSEGDLPDRLVFNRERRAVKSDKRTGVGSRPGKFTVPAGHRSPPVPDIDVSRDRDLGGGSVLIDNPDPANLPETRRPGQSVKQKQIVAADRRFHPDGGLTGEIAARRPRQHQTGFAVVGGGGGDVEIDPDPALSADRNHAQVILRSLVGPAPLLVAGGLIGKSHVDGGTQIDRGGTVRLLRKSQLLRSLCDFSGTGGETDSHHVARQLVGPLILNGQPEFPANRQGPVKRRNHQLGNLPVEER